MKPEQVAEYLMANGAPIGNKNAAGPHDGSGGGGAIYHDSIDKARGQLKALRDGGFKGRIKIEKSDRPEGFFLKKVEGSLAEREPQKKLTPFDTEIRRMKKFGTSDVHGALADHVYSHKGMRKEWEGDNADAIKKGHVTWEDASADIASSYLSMHGIEH